MWASMSAQSTLLMYCAERSCLAFGASANADGETAEEGKGIGRIVTANIGNLRRAD